jgi:glucokinase
LFNKIRCCAPNPGRISHEKSNPERRQWQVFQTLLQASDRISVQQIVAATGIDHPKVSAAIQYGEEQGWLATDEQSREELTATAAAASQLQAGLPERRALALLAEPGRIAMRDLAQTQTCR